MNAKASWTEGEQFVGIAPSNHAVVMDADRQGSNTAVTPKELVLIALCGCTATDVVSILRKKRERFTAVEVRAEAEEASEPPKVFTRIKLSYFVHGEVSRKAVEDAVRLSKQTYCSVSAMLAKTAEISTEIHLEQSA